MLVAVAVEMSVAQMSKLHVSFVKVSLLWLLLLPVSFLCHALDAAKQFHSLISG